MNDEETRAMNGVPREGTPQQYPSPYAGYVPQEYQSNGQRSFDPQGALAPEPQWHPYAGGPSTHDAEPRRPRRSMSGWLVPLVIVLLGLAAFGVVMMLLSRGTGHDGTATGPGVAQSAPAASQSPASQSPASGSSSSGASTSSGEAEFPADTSTACLGGTIEEPDIQIRNGSGSSCAYVSAIKSQVLAHLAEDAQATVFTVSPYSVARREYITLTCSRSDHLTRCTGGRNVDAYIKDRVG